MFLEMILKGLSWGLFGVAVLVPLCAFSVAWSHLGPVLRRKVEQEELELLTDLFEEDEDEPEPDLPSNEKPAQRYRFTPSTIVRPPNVVRKEDIENDD